MVPKQFKNCTLELTGEMFNGIAEMRDFFARASIAVPGGIESFRFEFRLEPYTASVPCGAFLPSEWIAYMYHLNISKEKYIQRYRKYRLSKGITQDKIESEISEFIRLADKYR